MNWLSFFVAACLVIYTGLLVLIAVLKVGGASDDCDVIGSWDDMPDEIIEQHCRRVK